MSIHFDQSLNECSPNASDETLHSYIKTQDQINGILLKNIEI